MPKYTSVVLTVGVLSAAAILAVAQQAPPQIKQVPIKPTSITSGPQMYTTYCAVCHGAGGKGDGPAAPALKTPPPDLTLLSQKNGGKFPSIHVMNELQSGVQNPAHGTAEMPIWGDLMMSLNSPGDATMQTHIRINNLTNYLKSIQK